MFRSRIDIVRSHFKKQKLDAVLISAVSNIMYLTGYNNFSKDKREAYIFIGQDFGYIITDGRYSGAIQQQVPHLTLFKRSHETSMEKLFKDLGRKIKILGIEEDELTIAEHKLLRKHFPKTKHFSIKTQRAIKTDEEIGKIQQAAKLGNRAFESILKKIKPGISEKELALEMEFFVKKNGAELSFPAIIAFGKNSAIPHHQTGQTILEDKEGQIVLLDFGVRLDNYYSDMTRTVFVGRPTDQQKKIYKIVLEAQQKAVDFINSAIKTGRLIKAAEVDKVVRDYIISKEYPSIPHSLGHGIGLEVHEYPSLSPKSKDILKEGMVFSIEPGIYIPDFGGVRIEDLFVLEKKGLKQITISSKELIAIH